MNTYRIGLIGARGYVGQEVIALLAKDMAFDLVLATSREHAGKPVRQIYAAAPDGLAFTPSTPAAVAETPCDIYFLGLPNGLAAPYVDAIERAVPDALIVDISADHRHTAGWVYGLSDLQAADIRGARRIANPGCYATAGILPLYPLRDLIAGVPSVFGVSGYSGAGTTPGPKNDPRRLANNVLPYGFANHGHQAEMSMALGRGVRFTPHVASFFRGLIVTATVPLAPGTQIGEVRARLTAAYRASETVMVTTAPPEPQMVSGTTRAVIGGAAIDPRTGVLAIACAHDNLLKGAASQALANARLALGLPRTGL